MATKQHEIPLGLATHGPKLFLFKGYTLIIHQTTFWPYGFIKKASCLFVSTGFYLFQHILVIYLTRTKEKEKTKNNLRDSCQEGRKDRP